jgi:hypothetical protein
VSTKTKPPLADLVWPRLLMQNAESCQGNFAEGTRLVRLFVDSFPSHVATQVHATPSQLPEPHDDPTQWWPVCTLPMCRKPPTTEGVLRVIRGLHHAGSVASVGLQGVGYYCGKSACDQLMVDPRPVLTPQLQSDCRKGIQFTQAEHRPIGPSAGTRELRKSATSNCESVPASFAVLGLSQKPFIRAPPHGHATCGDSWYLRRTSVSPAFHKEQTIRLTGTRQNLN